MVSEGGLEPPRPCGHQPLKLARLPIPPLRLACDSEERPESVARGRSGPCPPRCGDLRAREGRGGVVGRLAEPGRPSTGRTTAGCRSCGVAVTSRNLAAPDQGARLGEEREGHHVVPQLQRRPPGSRSPPWLGFSCWEALVTRLSNVLSS